MKPFLLFLLSACLALPLQAQSSSLFPLPSSLKVTRFLCSGPYTIHHPVMVDTVSLQGKAFDPETLLDAQVPDASRARQGSPLGDSILHATDSVALRTLYFRLENTDFTRAKISVNGLANMRLYVDGRKTETDRETDFLPMTHEVIIHCLSMAGGHDDTLSVTVTSATGALTPVEPSAPRLYTLTDVMEGRRVSRVSLSPSGRYLTTLVYDAPHSGRLEWTWQITELKTRRVVARSSDNISWMPREDAYYRVRHARDGREIVVTSLADGSERVLASGLPAEGSIHIAPTGQYVIIGKTEEGMTDDKDVHEIVDPDDRQPGWRDRTSLHLFDVATGICRPLTYGYRNASLASISRDGRYILFTTDRRRLTRRPTSLASLYRLCVETMQVDTLVADDGFMGTAALSPDGSQVAVMGSPECLGGIGLNLPEGRTPNMYDYQLYILDIPTGRRTPLTRDFNPSVEDFRWNLRDGRLYFTALDGGYTRLYRADTHAMRIEPVAVSEDVVTTFSLADTAPLLAYAGESVSNSYRVYTRPLAGGASTLVADYSAPALSGVALGRCEDWSFRSSRGDTITGWYYLPPHFDASRKYPMIVYYYGGCSPTTRYFEGHYPPHAYAAQGYVVYVINPSGAAGFGQEFASRHVATAGRGVAEDIIEGTRRFASEHPFVDAKHIGCIGASYGGFMTQYLQTQTDLFAAAVSHAGITSHTSYWGGGYWGYSYSEVSMADRYPWADRQLYVDQSPLYNADKIHTPLLLLHGTADHNVPTGESIQMYTALRMLGRDVAFVEVEGEDHGIMDYAKRRKWQNTIFAWFARYLKGDDTWWKAIYKPKFL